jgi:hypothetical protein
MFKSVEKVRGYCNPWKERGMDLTAEFTLLVGVKLTDLPPGMGHSYSNPIK